MAASRTACRIRKVTAVGLPRSGRQLVVLEVHRLDAADVDAGQLERGRRRRQQRPVGGVFERLAAFDLLPQQRADDAVAMATRGGVGRGGDCGSGAGRTAGRYRVAVAADTHTHTHTHEHTHTHTHAGCRMHAVTDFITVNVHRVCRRRHTRR